MFKKMSDKANELKDEFQAKYGPLTAAANTDENQWSWLNAPWPWENM